ncbi:hypothetical protein FHW88_002780 [Mucilaginibacter sp. SG538B]|uniref:SIR2 family protein n=1 Tax=Mucilaginibacter sp. SG538B TaxID=2587021 RepID=UPI00159D6E2F|nr:SIR2 family protein [Mucilaginibacter sp. SG538B]NVM64491.1 hypothetical protein [Mucilaginibacter sp. SG538B]
MIVWDDYLIRELALRKCIIVIGSGISKNSSNAAGKRPMTWVEFLDFANSKITKTSVRADVTKLIRSNDYLTACEVIKNTLTRNTFNDFMMDEYHTPGYPPAPIHETIFKLDSKIVVTPNFDRIYDTYASTTSNGTVIIKRHTDADVASTIRNHKRLIIKMHGTIDDVNEVIFTRSDYANARTRFKNFYTIMDALAITHTFLFLGCGTNDPDIRMMLEDYCYKFSFSREHYFVIPKGQNSRSVNKILESTMNLKMVEYSSDNHHAELHTGLAELLSKVEAQRDLIVDKQDW